MTTETRFIAFAEGGYVLLEISETEVSLLKYGDWAEHPEEISEADEAFMAVPRKQFTRFTEFLEAEGKQEEL